VAGFTDRLLAYLENFCGFPNASRAVRGVPEEKLVAFEKLFGGPIPPEYREFLARMGGDKKIFSLLEDDVDGFNMVWDWYEEPPVPGIEDFRPQGESIVIAVGVHTQLFLDGSNKGKRPVRSHQDEVEEITPMADSLESYCFQRAWREWRYSRLGIEGGVYLREDSEQSVLRAVQSAERAGFQLMPFSDSRHRILDGDRGAVLLQRERGDNWGIRVRIGDATAAQKLAEAIGDAAGGFEKMGS